MASYTSGLPCHGYIARQLKGNKEECEKFLIQYVAAMKAMLIPDKDIAGSVQNLTILFNLNYEESMLNDLSKLQRPSIKCDKYLSSFPTIRPDICKICPKAPKKIYVNANIEYENIVVSYMLSSLDACNDILKRKIKGECFTSLVDLACMIAEATEPALYPLFSNLYNYLCRMDENEKKSLFSKKSFDERCSYILSKVELHFNSKTTRGIYEKMCISYLNEIPSTKEEVDFSVSALIASKEDKKKKGKKKSTSSDQDIFSYYGNELTNAGSDNIDAADISSMFGNLAKSENSNASLNSFLNGIIEQEEKAKALEEQKEIEEEEKVKTSSMSSPLAGVRFVSNEEADSIYESMISETDACYDLGGNEEEEDGLDLPGIEIDDFMIPQEAFAEEVPRMEIEEPEYIPPEAYDNYNEMFMESHVGPTAEDLEALKELSDEEYIDNSDEETVPEKTEEVKEEIKEEPKEVVVEKPLESSDDDKEQKDIPVVESPSDKPAETNAGSKKKENAKQEVREVSFTESLLCDFSDLEQIACNITSIEDKQWVLMEEKMLNDKRLSIECCVDENGKEFLVFYSYDLHMFLCTDFADGTSRSRMKKLLSYPSVKKYCYNIFRTVSFVVNNGLEIKGIISLFVASYLLYPGHRNEYSTMMQLLGAKPVEPGVNMVSNHMPESDVLKYLNSYFFVYYRIEKKFKDKGLLNAFLFHNDYALARAYSIRMENCFANTKDTFSMKSAGQYVEHEITLDLANDKGLVMRFEYSNFSLREGGYYNKDLNVPYHVAALLVRDGTIRNGIVRILSLDLKSMTVYIPVKYLSEGKHRLEYGFQKVFRQNGMCEVFAKITVIGMKKKES